MLPRFNNRNIFGAYSSEAERHQQPTDHRLVGWNVCFGELLRKPLMPDMGANPALCGLAESGWSAREPL